jgi:hypothetical protein
MGKSLERASITIQVARKSPERGSVASRARSNVSRRCRRSNIAFTSIAVRRSARKESQRRAGQSPWKLFRQAA